jgi:hypothetical protein
VYQHVWLVYPTLCHPVRQAALGQLVSQST